MADNNEDSKPESTKTGSKKPPIPKKPPALRTPSDEPRKNSSGYADVVIQAEIHPTDDQIEDDRQKEPVNKADSVEARRTSDQKPTIIDDKELTEIDLEQPESKTLEEACELDKIEISKKLNQEDLTKSPDVFSKSMKPVVEVVEKSQVNKKDDPRVSITLDDSILLPPVGSYRFGVALLTLASILLANMNRQAFNQALSEMIKPNDPNSWTSKQASELKQAFSSGYAIFMIPSARLGEIFGAKWIVFASTFGSGLCSILVPYFADNNHFTMTKISRFAMGICQAGVAPALYALLARWLSVDESNRFIPLIKGGVSFGLLLGAGTVGLMSWRLTFYFCGGIALASAAIWSFYVTSLPEQNRLLSKDELNYIQQQMRIRDGTKKKRTEIIEPEVKGDTKQTADVAKESIDPDASLLDNYVEIVVNEAKLWFKIFINWPVIGIILVKWTMRLSTDAQTQYLADFFKYVHQLSKEKNSIVNCTNYALQGILTFHIVWLSNLLLDKRPFNLSKTGIRRLFQCGCSFGMAISFFLITFDLSSLDVSLWAVILLALTNIMQSGADSILPYDLSPTYSATIMGVANSIANSAGILLPEIHTHYVGNDVQNLAKWGIFFYIVSALIASGGFIFILMVKAEVQAFDPSYPQSRLNILRQKQDRLKLKNARYDIEMMRYEPKQEVRKDSLKKPDASDFEAMTSRKPIQTPKMSQLSFQEWRATKSALRESTKA